MAKKRRQLRVASDDPSDRNGKLATQLDTLWVMDEIEKIEWVDTPSFKGWRATIADDE